MSGGCHICFLYRWYPNTCLDVTPNPLWSPKALGSVWWEFNSRQVLVVDTVFLTPIIMSISRGSKLFYIKDYPLVFFWFEYVLSFRK